MDEKQQFHTVRGYQLLDQNKNLLTSAMEDYLEMIYRNSLVEGYMRINTLSDLLNVQAPSTTKMVQKLNKLGLIDYKKYGIIFLTDSGKHIGQYLLKRHNIIETFLSNLDVRDNLLVETELIEHSVSVNTLSKLELFNRFIEANPDIQEMFKKYTAENG